VYLDSRYSLVKYYFDDLYGDFPPGQGKSAFSRQTISGAHLFYIKRLKFVSALRIEFSPPCNYTAAPSNHCSLAP
jgi:hypothetical protein